MDALNTLMQWVVAPVAAFVWLLHNKSSSLSSTMVKTVHSPAHRFL